MKMLHVNNFSGGINNYVSPKAIPDGQMQELCNGIGDGICLRPAKAPAAIGEYTLEELGHYGWINRSVVKWFGRWYWSFNDAEAPPYYGGNVTAPGVQYPLSAPAVSSSGTGLTGTYQYCITFLNASLWESAPGESSVQWWATLVLDNTAGAITLPSVVPDDIAYMRLYRTVDQGNTFYMVGQYNTFEYAGEVINDSLADIDLVLNNPLETINLLPPPPGGRFLTERDGVFFLAVDDRLFVSAQSNPNAWNYSNWIGFEGNDITGITKEYNGILVFTANKTFRVTGSDITNLAKQEIPGQQGCLNWRTIGTAGPSPAWMSNDGLCIWDGSQITIVSKQRYVFNGDPVHAVCANDKYYLFMTVGVVVFDYRAGGVFRTMNETTEYGWYDADLDRFYMADTNSANLLDIRVFEAGDNLKYKYISGMLPQDGMTQKRFRRLFIDAGGRVTVQITADTGRTFNLILQGSGKLHCYLPAGFYGRGITVQLESSSAIYVFTVEYEEIGI